MYLKRIIKFASIVFFMYGLLVLSACTSLKYSLYEMAINHEREKAGLTTAEIGLDEGKIAFLDTPDFGGKTTVVLLHGFAANKDNWVRFARYLSGQYRVVAIDLPGHGESFKDMSLRYDLDDQVHYLHTILERLNIQTFHLAGNSMGGAIAGLYAASYPKAVLSVWLFNPGGIYEHESELMQLLEKGENPLIVQTADDFDVLMDFALEKKPFIPWPITSVMAEKAVANKPINDKIFADIKGSHGYVFQDELKKIEAPTLILWGKMDRIIDVKNADIFESLIPNSRKVIFDDVGHAPMIEIPEKSARICLDFISTDSKRKSGV